MAGVNKVILLGNLGADPEVKYLEGDKAVAKLRLATTESYKDRNGNRVDQTEWHDLEMWDGQAKIAEQYLKKGSQIYVEGKIKTDTWQDDQGQNKYRTKIRVLSFTMLGGKPDGMGGNQPHLLLLQIRNLQQLPVQPTQVRIWYWTIPMMICHFKLILGSPEVDFQGNCLFLQQTSFRLHGRPVPELLPDRSAYRVII